jgi:hypothetical protein
VNSLEMKCPSATTLIGCELIVVGIQSIKLQKVLSGNLYLMHNKGSSLLQWGYDNRTYS